MLDIQSVSHDECDLVPPRRYEARLCGKPQPSHGLAVAVEQMPSFCLVPCLW
jgi:hypothetical protein